MSVPKRSVKQEASNSKDRNGRHAATRTSGSNPASSASATGDQTLHPADQLKKFETAVRLFRNGRYQEARDLFQDVMEGPDRGMAHTAELHTRMCNRRLETPTVELKTAEEHYNYAIALINARKIDEAQRHLLKALEEDRGADHVYYAMALCRGLTGDLQGAYENLKRAIELHPRNRIAARQDSDFAPFAKQPPLDRLLFPEKKSNPV